MTRTVSAKRAKKQGVNRAALRRLLEADWAESSYGTVRVGPGGGRGRRVREETDEEREVGYEAGESLDETDESGPDRG